MLYKILKFLSGKKSIIIGIILTTLSFLAAKQILNADVVAYIGAILTIVFGTASVATKSIVYPTQGEQ